MIYSLELTTVRFTKEKKLEDLEIWKYYDVSFESNGLLVSNFGRMKLYDFRDRTEGDNGAGYKNVNIYNKELKKAKKFYVHRLVAELFLEKPCDSKKQVNHIDGNKGNNHYTNLEWVSPKENIKHMHVNSLSKNRRELGSIVKLPDEVIMSAYLAVKIGMLGIRESADKFGMPRTTLSSIMNKRSRRGVTDAIDNHFGL